jgi:hypothetical protein
LVLSARSGAVRRTTRGKSGHIRVEVERVLVGGEDPSRARESTLWMNSRSCIHSDFPARSGVFQIMGDHGAGSGRPKRPNRNFASYPVSSRYSWPADFGLLSGGRRASLVAGHPPSRIRSDGRIVARTDAGRPAAAALDSCLRGIAQHSRPPYPVPVPPHHLSRITHEEDLPTQSSSQKAPSRFPRPDADPRRPGDVEKPSPQGPEATRCLTTNPSATLETFVESSTTGFVVATVRSSWSARQGRPGPPVSGSSSPGHVARR